jgi:carotenoid cleavage dioxygenase-like enzyme
MRNLFFKKKQSPYVCYGAISPSGKLLLDVSVPFEHGTMVHDFVITKNYAVIPIFPLKLGMKSGFDKTGKSKFAVIPRYAKDASSIIWLEFEPCFCFHYANAWEENEDELVVVGCPLPDGFELDKFSTQQRKVPVQPSHNFTKWTLNIKNKTVRFLVNYARSCAS